MNPSDRLDRFVSLLEQETGMAGYLGFVFQAREMARRELNGTSDAQMAQTLDALADRWAMAGDAAADVAVEVAS